MPARTHHLPKLLRPATSSSSLYSTQTPTDTETPDDPSQLSDDAALLSTVQTLLSIQPSLPSKTLIDTSTVHPDTTTQVTTLLTSASASFISAPVFGATPVAQAGRLLFALAGPPEAVSLVSPYISSCLARRIIHVSSNPRDATLLKTTGNFLTAALQESIAEAHVFAELAGLNGDVVHELVEGNYGEYAGGVSEKMLQGVYAPPKGQRSRSDARLAVKDVGHGLSVAGSVGARLEVGEVTMRRLRGAVEWGNREGREVDSSAVYGVVRVEAGLGFEREKKVGGSEAVEEPVESDDR